MKIVKYINIIVLSAVVIALIYLYRENNNNNNRIVYVDAAKIFKEFELTKEYNQKMNKSTLARQAILDSLKFEIQKQKASAKAKDKNLEIVVENYYKTKEEFEKANSNMANKFDLEIWSQINQYLKDYGTEKNYDFVLGATGNGTIMFSKESKNVTEEAILYINKKFKGK